MPAVALCHVYMHARIGRGRRCALDRLCTLVFIAVALCHVFVSLRRRGWVICASERLLSGRMMVIVHDVPLRFGNTRVGGPCGLWQAIRPLNYLVMRLWCIGVALRKWSACFHRRVIAV